MVKVYSDVFASSGLKARELGEIEAVCRDFCGRRMVATRLKEGLARAEGEQRAKIEKELALRDDDAAMDRRYGKAVMDLLRGREQELIRLHAATSGGPRLRSV